MFKLWNKKRGHKLLLQDGTFFFISRFSCIFFELIRMWIVDALILNYLNQFRLITCVGYSFYKNINRRFLFLLDFKIIGWFLMKCIVVICAFFLVLKKNITVRQNKSSYSKYETIKYVKRVMGEKTSSHME